MSLSTQELTQLRADAADYFPDTCTIQTVTRAEDDTGGYSESWANTYTGVACRMAPIRSDQPERVEGDQVQALSRWILTVAHDQAMDETMRVVHDGETYEVAHLEDTHSNRTAKRAYLRRQD